MTRSLAIRALVFLVCLAQAHAIGDRNLLFNGSFENEEDPLKGWVHDYTWSGNTHYANNHKHVSIVPGKGTRGNILKIALSEALLDNQGVKIDGKPVPIERHASYRLAVRCRTTGPNCRILIEGYRWKSGIKPHDNPTLGELQKVFRQGSGQILYFSGKSGSLSNPGRGWKLGSCKFPSGRKLSDLARTHLKKVKFVVVHVVAIQGAAGDLYLDNVTLTKLGR